MDYLSLCKNRYSCRMLQDRPVEQEKIDRIIEAGLCAPTAVNKQPFRIFVIQSPEALEKAAVSYPFDFVRKAPVLLVIGAQENEAWIRKYDERNFADVDATIVATHVLLAIEAEGLSTTWIGHFDPSALKEAFPQMEGLDLIAMFPVAYAAADAEPGAKHEICRPASELVQTI